MMLKRKRIQNESGFRELIKLRRVNQALEEGNEFEHQRPEAPLLLFEDNWS